MTTIPITVLGGYLGSGKTTLLNALLRRADGRRIGVVVNDFGDLAVDADLLADAMEDGPLVSLANGCVCCTLGDDLRAVLHDLSQVTPALDHIVIEASGVADPLVLAAWGTVPPFSDGGVVVLAAADSIRVQARDRYVGGEVRRQLVGADLVLLTKVDRCAASDVQAADDWIREVSGAPVTRASFGEVPLEVVLGARPVDDRVRRASDIDDHAAGYERWTSEWTGPLRRNVLDAFLSELPPGVLRLKGFVEVESSSGAEWVVVNVVGRNVAVQSTNTHRRASVLTAIGCDPDFDVNALQRNATSHGIG